MKYAKFTMLFLLIASMAQVSMIVIAQVVNDGILVIDLTYYAIVILVMFKIHAAVKKAIYDPKEDVSDS